MENKLIRKTGKANSHQQPNSLAMHRDSHTISKPKIRIIHIFAPEIIKTDAENFRELVQKLTGKPSGGPGEKKYCCKKKITKVAAAGRDQQESRSCSSNSGLSAEDSRMMMTKNEFWGMDQTKGDNRSSQSVKEEIGSVCSTDDERSGGGGGGGGYLGGFSDLEGFISEIGGFPMLPIPMDGTTHMQMQGFEL